MSETEYPIRNPLTIDQEMDICWIIGEWYLKWKNHLVDYDTRTHQLGYAKEDLKRMICRERSDEEIDRNLFDKIKRANEERKNND